MKSSRMIVAIAMLTGSWSIASAAIVQVTYTGTVSGSSSDGLGLFGTMGATLDGDPFKAVFRFDTSIGRMTDPGFSDQATGGILSPSPSLGSSLTINGRTATIAGSSLAADSAGASPNGQVSQTQFTFDDITSGSIETTKTLSLNVMAGGIPLSIDTPFTYRGGNISGLFAFSSSDPSFSGSTMGNLVGGTLVTSVPEPSTWAMMLIGLLGIGLVASRQSRASCSRPAPSSPQLRALEA